MSYSEDLAKSREAAKKGQETRRNEARDRLFAALYEAAPEAEIDRGNREGGHVFKIKGGEVKVKVETHTPHSTRFSPVAPKAPVRITVESVATWPRAHRRYTEGKKGLNVAGAVAAAIELAADAADYTAGSEKARLDNIDQAARYERILARTRFVLPYGSPSHGSVEYRILVPFEKIEAFADALGAIEVLNPKPSE